MNKKQSSKIRGEKMKIELVNWYDQEVIEIKRMYFLIKFVLNSL